MDEKDIEAALLKVRDVLQHVKKNDCVLVIRIQGKNKLSVSVNADAVVQSRLDEGLHE